MVVRENGPEKLMFLLFHRNLRFVETWMLQNGFSKKYPFLQRLYVIVRNRIYVVC